MYLRTGASRSFDVHLRLRPGCRPSPTPIRPAEQALMKDTPDRLAVELVPHCREWAKMVAAETLRLKGALGDNFVTVHHIGSTAIPAIRAKPIVDLLPVVRSLDDLDTKKSAIHALGY